MLENIQYFYITNGYNITVLICAYVFRATTVQHSYRGRFSQNWVVSAILLFIMMAHTSVNASLDIYTHANVHFLQTHTQ